MIRIVSGGQTGADRAALDLAVELELETGGWIPRGRRAEDGRSPARYKGLTEADSLEYSRRTELNVRDSDATLVFTLGEPAGGTARTVECARRLERPHLVVDPDRSGRDAAVREVRDWLVSCLAAPLPLCPGGPGAGRRQSRRHHPQRAGSRRGPSRDPHVTSGCNRRGRSAIFSFTTGRHRVRNVVSSIEAEFRRYKALGDGAMAQLPASDLVVSAPGGGNSVAVIAWHVGGNLKSRFTDFLTTDGEKPWRHREEEFAARSCTNDELSAHWETGWRVLLASLAELDDGSLGRTVTIRGVELRVDEALHRALAHVAYHVGQIVLLARSLRGADWKFLSIPPGGTDAYNENPTRERAGQHTDQLGGTAIE